MTHRSNSYSKRAQLYLFVTDPLWFITELYLEGITALNETIIDFEVSAWEYFTLSNGLEYLASIQPSNQRVEVFHLDLTLQTPLTSVFNYSGKNFKTWLSYFFFSFFFLSVTYEQGLILLPISEGTRVLQVWQLIVSCWWERESVKWSLAHVIRSRKVLILM